MYILWMNTWHTRLRAKVSTAIFWQNETPRVTWLKNFVSAERNLSTHGFIYSDLRKRLAAKTLERANFQKPAPPSETACSDVV